MKTKCPSRFTEKFICYFSLAKKIRNLNAPNAIFVALTTLKLKWALS